MVNEGAVSVLSASEALEPSREPAVGSPVQKLTSEQVAEFISRGFLRFDGVVPEEINQLALQELRRAEELSGRGTVDGIPSPLDERLFDSGKSRLSEHFGQSPGIRAFCNLPIVRGAFESLVGPDPYHDSHAVHTRKRGTPSQHLHADAIFDMRAAFDIQLMYYPQQVTKEGGGTMVVPGSHLRQVDGGTIARYQNFAGQVYMEGSRGSVLVVHNGIWHCGRRNRTDAVRYMFKVRLGARVRQIGLWDAGDLTDDDVRRRVWETLYTLEPWFEGPAGNIERLQRLALFRRMSGDSKFGQGQLDDVIGRVENQALPRLRDIVP
jgi:Phytanoyl-CoA dioxygenase (PhyH)